MEPKSISTQKPGDAECVVRLFNFGIKEDREVLAERLKQFETHDLVKIKEEEAAVRESERILEKDMPAPA